MSFTVEDGTVVSGANSYVSVAYADTYHDDRSNASWANINTAQKQSALIKATDYIEQTYELRWIGWRISEIQPLSWPRGFHDPDLYDTAYEISGEIPDKIKQAVCLLALESISSDLNPTQGRNVKREKVDVIEVEYQDGAKIGKTRPAIDGLLRRYLSGGSLNARTVRV